MADCRVVVDGDEDESYLICLTCDPGREVCCGHHLAPHDAEGCHERVGQNECACRRPALDGTEADRCDPATGRHANPHIGCVLR